MPPPNITPPLPYPPLPYPPPMPYPQPMPPSPDVMPVAVPCVPPAPVEPPGTSRFRIVKENGKSRLEMKGADGNRATCVRLALKTRSASSLRLCAGKKQVHVYGRSWKAAADKVETSPDGALVLLSGHVKLASNKAGSDAKVKAERVCVQLRDGHVEIALDKPAR
jgi:hypothetical protein